MRRRGLLRCGWASLARKALVMVKPLLFSKPFAKKLEHHIGAIWHFVHRYNSSSHL
jgi:hypothetical protein